MKMTPCRIFTGRLAAGIAAGVAFVGLLSGCSGSSGGADKVSPNTLLSAGIAAENQGRSEAAKQLFQQVLAKDPKNTYAYYNLGLIAQRANDNVTALRDYGLALTINPTYVPALYNEGTIYGSTNPALAMTTYRQVLKLQPTSQSALLNLGLLEVTHSQHGKGITDLVAAIRIDPTLAKRLPHKLLIEVAKASQKKGSHVSPTPSSTP
jgi:tetratricopeptide (TPR) repeat protein